MDIGSIAECVARVLREVVAMGLPDLTGQVLKSIPNPEGNRRVEIRQREDGLVQFVDLEFLPAYVENDRVISAGYWTGCPSGLFQTSDEAEQEARVTIPWLRDMNPTVDPYASAISFSFGDTPEMADMLLKLVLKETKTATCGALRDYSDGQAELPVVGRRDLVLDGHGRRAAVIETLQVAIRRFDEVDEAFAFDEGEDDRTLRSWREGHRRYFERNGGFSPEMQLVCERFCLVAMFDR